MKILRAGKRPFIALGTMFGLLLLIPLFLGIGMGKWTDAGKMAGCILAVAVLVLGPIVAVAVEVDEEEIRVRYGGVTCKRVRFQDIDHTSISVLAEKDWPVSLTIFANNPEVKPMWINLKVYRREDVAWLMGLSRLRITR